MPPGDMSSSAANQQFDIKVMSVMAAPVMLFVLVYSGYSWSSGGQGRGRRGRPAHQGNTRIQFTWIAVTSVIVLALFAFGTFELAATSGAGAGEGPARSGSRAAAPLQVQVIAQQWRFTYRYPQFGGFETTQLVLPVGQDVQFNVTSLDVIHSFWAYQLGVKADANPRRQQRRLHHAEHTGRCHRAMRRAVRPVARRDVRLRPGGVRRGVPVLGARDRGQDGGDHRDAAALRDSLRPDSGPEINKAMAKAGHRRGQRLLLPAA